MTKALAATATNTLANSPYRFANFMRPSRSTTVSIRVPRTQKNKVGTAAF
jgi:hypothetical protein